MCIFSRIVTILAVFQALVGVTFAAPEPDSDPVQYERIYIEDPAEYPQIYDLLDSYLANPELALSVKEIQFRPHKFLEADPQDCPQLEADAAVAFENISWPRLDPDDSMVHSIQSLLPVLSDEQKHQYLRSLTWMRPELVERRKHILGKPDMPPSMDCHVKALVPKRDHEFVYHATALLLRLCLNLERLVYQDNDQSDNPVKHLMKRFNYNSLWMLSNQRFLSSLKDIVLLPADDTPSDDHQYYTFMDILELLRMFHRLPSINSVFSGGLGLAEGWRSEKFPANTTNLKKITIVHSHIDGKVIEALARAPIALEEFTMTTGGRALPGRLSSPTQVKWLGKALQCQKSSLTKLDLDLGTTITAHEYAWLPDGHVPNDEPLDPGRPLPEFTNEQWRDIESRARIIDEWEAQGPELAMELRDDREYGETIGSLHDFEKLTHLSIGIELLFSCCCCQDCGRGASLGIPFRLVDALPPKLRYLTIRGYKKGQNAEVDEHFAEFLKLKSERFPELTEIHGLDKLIPGGQHVRNPDRDTHLLWKPEPRPTPGWVQAKQQPPVVLETGNIPSILDAAGGAYFHDEI